MFPPKTDLGSSNGRSSAANEFLLRSVRGATTLPADTPEAITEAVLSLLGALRQKNRIDDPDSIVSVFFTLTPDLRSLSPAKVARLDFGWQQVPMFCAQEPVIEGFPARCIRVLIQFYTTQPVDSLRHVYLNEAVSLRPDLA